MPDQTTGVIPAACFTQNRATLHLHGGVTPWISDGTTHQWITPVGEATAYPEGLSVFNVPDMDNAGKPGGPTNPSGSGVQTFYWTNDQAARLMFYHDHASGITRLNVYVGEAAGYLLRDDAEAALENAGLIPGLLDNIPLVLQEKGFVDAATIGVTDPTWNWGTGAPGTYTDAKSQTMNKRAPKTGDLWWPHVYQPAQNPSDLSGYNATGRWNYGPWFFPPTPIPYGPMLNPYNDCDTGEPCTMPWQPYEIPGTPNPSWGAEAFLDTPVINGTAYPTLTVEAKPYRFRILNAGGDRFFNLQLYQAFDKNTDTTAGGTGPTPVACDGGPALADCTEVKMVPAAPGIGLPLNWPKDGREGGVPDPATAGPSFFVIGTEGGFLPMPVEVPPQPVVWNNDPLDLQLRKRVGLLAPPRTGGAGGCRRRFQRHGGQDVHPLQRRARRVPGPGSSKRLLHGQSRPDGHRRHYPDPPGPGAQHTHPDADQRSASDWDARALQPGGSASGLHHQSRDGHGRRFQGLSGRDRRGSVGLRRHLRQDLPVHISVVGAGHDLQIAT